MKDENCIKKYLINSKCWLDADGHNLFEIALNNAMKKERQLLDVNIQEFGSNKTEKGYLTYGQESYIGKIGVEYHNRWCFYLLTGDWGKIFLTDFDRQWLDHYKEYPVNPDKLKPTENYHDAILSAAFNCGVLV